MSRNKYCLFGPTQQFSMIKFRGHPFTRRFIGEKTGDYHLSFDTSFEWVCKFAAGYPTGIFKTWIGCVCIWFDCEFPLNAAHDLVVLSTDEMQKQWVEIKMVFHVLLGPKEMQGNGIVYAYHMIWYVICQRNIICYNKYIYPYFKIIYCKEANCYPRQLLPSIEKNVYMM